MGRQDAELRGARAAAIQAIRRARAGHAVAEQAVSGVIVQESECDLGESSLHSVDLRQHVDAVALFRAAGECFREEIQPSGYLVGDSFTVADLTVAAIVAPAIAPEQFPYPQPQRDCAFGMWCGRTRRRTQVNLISRGGCR